MTERVRCVVELNRERLAEGLVQQPEWRTKWPRSAGARGTEISLEDTFSAECRRR